MPSARIRRLGLTNFRSYHAAQLAAGAGPIVLVGANGAGKTNLIEAISFLAPGRGLRRATLQDVAFSEGDGSWAVSADVEGALGLVTLGTGIAPPAADDTLIARQYRIEHETAELAVAVTALRVESVGRMQAVLATRRTPGSAFPAAAIALDGWMEKLIPLHPAVEIEDRYRAILRDNRASDAAAGRTLEGPHLTDLTVIHADKGIAAAQASTGEQKALLIGLVLAHAGLLAEMSGLAPVLLLDEVLAHLDPVRRAALHVEIDKLGAQAWMTGADLAAFAEIAAKAEIFEVSPGEIRKRGA